MPHRRDLGGARVVLPRRAAPVGAQHGDALDLAAPAKREGQDTVVLQQRREGGYKRRQRPPAALTRTCSSTMPLAAASYASSRSAAWSRTNGRADSLTKMYSGPSKRRVANLREAGGV